MSLFHSILLGVIQGVTEFLPVSSSGHLAIAEHLLGMEGAAEIPEFFDVLLHFGTLIAVFASSTAVASFVMAEQMGGDAKLAGNIVVVTSACASFTLFAWSLLFKALGAF